MKKEKTTPKKKPFLNYDDCKSIDRDVYQHEVFFSFRNDDDAIKFNDWWQATGNFLFQEYLDTEVTKS